MAFIAPAIRWPDALAPYLPAQLRDVTAQQQYAVIASVTLAVLVLTVALTRSSQKLESPHAVVADSARSDRRARSKTPTVLLVGLSDSGKTSLFSHLVYGAVPDTLPSQRESQGLIQPAQLLESGQAEVPKITVLIDLPGHPRLRPKVDEYINQADGVVICVDATSATKSATARQDREANDVAAAADLIHGTLNSLAKQRLRSTSSSTLASPSVLVLFTRSDLSTLLSATGADAAKDTKRRHQLLTRCRTAVETELGQRRAGMGLGRRSAGVRIAGVGKVVDGEPSSLAPSGGIFGWLKRALGLSGSTSGRNGNAAQDDDDEDAENEETLDYVDWRAARREAAAADQQGGSAAFSLEKLDEDVVSGGKVEWALASVGKVRGWETKEDPATDEDGLRELRSWLCRL